MSRASLKRRARFLHARKQKGRIRIIQNTLAPVERKPDGTLYRMTPAQHREAKKIIRRLCSNYCDGNCIRLDKGEEVPCPQMLSASVCCRFFRNVLLKDPEAGALEAGFFHPARRNAAQYVEKSFIPQATARNIALTAKLALSASSRRNMQDERGRASKTTYKENQCI